MTQTDTAPRLRKALRDIGQSLRNVLAYVCNFAFVAFVPILWLRDELRYERPFTKAHFATLLYTTAFTALLVAGIHGVFTGHPAILLWTIAIWVVLTCITVALVCSVAFFWPKSEEDLSDW